MLGQRSREEEGMDFLQDRSRGDFQDREAADIEEYENQQTQESCPMVSRARKMGYRF